MPIVGFTNRATSTMAIVTGVWNVLSRIALPVVAIVALWWGNDQLPAPCVMPPSAA